MAIRLPSPENLAALDGILERATIGLSVEQLNVALQDALCRKSPAEVAFLYLASCRRGQRDSCR